MKKLLFQVIKFGLVGGIAFIIDYTLLYVLTNYIGIYYLVSAGISFIISTVFNYIVSMRYVFKGKENISHQKELAIFIFLSGLGLVLNQIIMFVSVDKLKIFYMYAKLLATIIVMVWNFVTRKIFLEEKS